MDIFEAKKFLNECDLKRADKEVYVREEKDFKNLNSEDKKASDWILV